jgi:tRNA(fMet)-specific endonuclease VapC
LAVLIDTGVLVERERGESETIVVEEGAAISVITVSELLHGVHRARGATRSKRRAFVEHLLATFEPVPITEPVARVHAEVWSELAGRGDVLGAHDLWIAATALTHAFGIVTNNLADFGRVPGLRVVEGR